MTTISLTSINFPVQLLILQDVYLPALNENERKQLGMHCFFSFFFVCDNGNSLECHLNHGPVYNLLFTGDVSFTSSNENTWEVT